MWQPWIWDITLLLVSSDLGKVTSPPSESVFLVIKWREHQFFTSSAYGYNILLIHTCGHYTLWLYPFYISKMTIIFSSTNLCFLELFLFPAQKVWLLIPGDLVPYADSWWSLMYLWLTLRLSLPATWNTETYLVHWQAFIKHLMNSLSQPCLCTAYILTCYNAR